MSLKVGDKAPDFTLKLADGSGTFGTFTLSEALTKGPVTLAFFPMAFSGVCTKELCTFRDGLGDFKGTAGHVVGVSIDHHHVQNAFAKAQNLGFPLLADPNREVVPKFSGIYDLGPVKSVAKRSVFVVGKDGKVLFQWVTDNAENLPPFEEIKAVVRKASA